MGGQDGQLSTLQVLADQLTLSQSERADYAHPALAFYVTDTKLILYESFIKDLKKMYEI